MTNVTSSTADEKMRYRLDLEAHQIDTVLDRHQVAGAVTSGTVQQRIVEFDVQAPLSAGLERMRGLRDSMMAALGVRDLSVGKQDGRWRLKVERDYEPLVPLSGLLAGLPGLPPGTAAIGQSDSNQPVLLSFGPSAVRHVLIAGEDGAGKTTLLRTIATSLALTSRQSEVQLLLIDGGPEAGDGSVTDPLWHPLTYLPHIMTDPVSGPDVGAEVLRFLVGEMAYRRKQRVRLPRIVVLIDNAVALLQAGGQQLTDDMLRLLQHGSANGIHLVLATSQPESSLLDVLFMTNLPVRLVGRLSEQAQARKVSGAEESQAEYLRGSGEFIAITDGQQTYFQAADMSNYDLHWELNQLLTTRRPRLLARPYSTLSTVQEPVPFAAQPFERKNGVRWVDSSVTEPPQRRATSSATILDADPDTAGEQS